LISSFNGINLVRRCCLVEGSLAIDELELQKLIDTYAAKLVLYARQWCCYPDDAVQEAFMDAARLSSLPADPAAWLFKTTRYKALNQQRSESRRSKLQHAVGMLRDHWFQPDLSATLQSDELTRAIEQLDETPREIIVARIWGELSFEQVAQLVGLPTTTAFRIYRQTLEQLRIKLEGSRASSRNTQSESKKDNT
jgi:RNA polymerase sigma factor (sigma-70 family)